MFPWRSGGIVSCHSFSVAALGQNSSLVTFLHNGTHYSLIKFAHDLLAPCNSCPLVVLGKPTVGSFLTSWLSCRNCNLVLNCVGSLRRYRKQNCKMESALSYWNWPKNQIMTLFLTDGVLLGIRNRKERCHAWSFVATTSHIRTLSMLFFLDSTGMSSTLFVPCLALRPGFAYVSPTLIKYTLAFCYHRTHLHHIMDAQTVLYITILTPFQPNEWRSFLNIHWSSSAFQSSLAMERSHPPTLEAGQGNHVYFYDFST
jgi:hypothetical protein